MRIKLKLNTDLDQVGIEFNETLCFIMTPMTYMRFLIKKQVWLIDMAIPGDCRIDQKEVEKITKYQDLKIEVEKLWEKKAIVVPVVFSDLGAIPRDLIKHLRT